MDLTAAARALELAADAARYAPSIHNTQPWRWMVRAPALELYAERSRQLSGADPAGELLLLSCGTALHHAQVALDAEGWRYEVDRPAGEPLAVIRAVESGEVDPAAMHHFQTTLIRHTDRRALTDEPVDAATLDAVRSAAEQHGARLHVLRGNEVIDLAVAVEQAGRIESLDQRQLDDLAAWVGGNRQSGTGVPDTAIPVETPSATVAERDFGRSGALDAGSGHDMAAVYALLYGDSNEPIAWLRAGEALSAAWLAATEAGLSLLPFSAPIEVPATRQALRRSLSGVGYPYLAMRLGMPDPEHAGPPHTPRLGVDQIVEVVDPAG
jgi:nitroreductase